MSRRIFPQTAYDNYSSFQAKIDLFIVSLTILFLELACIRWFPAHVLYLTYFTNIVLLACFLGMSVGCLAATRLSNLLVWSPVVLIVVMALAHFAAQDAGRLLEKTVIVGNQSVSPEIVFFGTEHFNINLAPYVMTIETLCGVFFVSIAFIFVGLGQELGRAFNRTQNRVQAYSINIFGSIIGIILFTGFSWLELNPYWWFSLVVMGFAYFIFFKRMINSRRLFWEMALAFVAILYLSSLRSGNVSEKGLLHEFKWSPYYLVHHIVNNRLIEVNLISHQQMLGTQETMAKGFKYAFPYLLQRDAGGKPFEEVLIIGAGTGNDVSRALQWGARHVDAVEIDPVIFRIGQQFHPDNPYQDPRVQIYLDDGRNFMRHADRKYDLIIYALVDSLVLHSTYSSNIRLESFLFTQEAFTDVRHLLKKDGLFVMYNFFRQGWIVARLDKTLTEVFGQQPIVLPFPYRPTITENNDWGFTVIISGNTNHLADAFARWHSYSLRTDTPPQPDSTNGFLLLQEGQNIAQLKIAKVLQPENLFIATDDWPFLYLRKPMIPRLSIKGIFMMGSLAFLMILCFMPKVKDTSRKLTFNGRMFFLGAGFMLIETKAVVQMTLLFGSTWMVNSLVILSILIMILGANLYILKFRSQNLAPYFLLLFVSLALNSLIPLDYFLGMEKTFRIVGSCLLVFTPVLLAGVIFAISFDRSQQPDVDFSFNIAGAIAGGLSEYSVTLIGFQYLVLVAMLFYFLSMVLAKPICISRSYSG